MSKKIRTPFAAILLIIIIVLNVFQFTDLCGYIFRFRNVFNVFSAITLAIELVLCGTLFAKKFNNIVVIVLGCETLMTLIDLVRYFAFFSLLDFVAYALLTVFALAVCEQTLVKADLSKVKEIGKKLFYLPAIVYLVSRVCNLITLTTRGGTITVFHIVNILLYGIVLLNLGMWLKAPYEQPKVVHNTTSAPASTETNGSPTSEGEYEEAYCSMLKHIVLCLFTCGIWYLIWIYRTTKYLNKAPNAEQYNPTSKLLLCMFIPFYQIYWFYKHGQRVDSMSKQKKLESSDMATLCLILGIFVPVVACILMQDRINILCTTKAVVEEQKAEGSTTDQLKKYKELLDSGVITQEEFDAKKKELLGL